MKIAKEIKTVFQLFPHLKTSTYPAQVKIIEVSPRDGLQNEKQNVPT